MVKNMKYDLDNMTPKDLEKLINFLKEFLGTTYTSKNTISKVIKQEIEKVECPYCHQNDCIIKSGFTTSKVQRYKCKNCNKKFIVTANTVCYHSKLSFGSWKLYFECMSDNLSIRKTAAKMGVNKNTVFAMRHKVLNVLSTFRENVKLSGKMEADEFTIPINFKGMKQENMPRFSKKRKSASKKVNHKVCVLGAIDENDNQYLEIVCNGEITSDDIEKSLGSKLENGTLLVTDCRSSYESFAKNHSLKLEQVKSGTYKNSNGYTLSEINGLHSNFFNFYSKFRGVSTKHLQGYIDWFVYKKYIDYTVEIINHPSTMLYYSITQKGNITIKNIFNAPFPFDITNAYADYNSAPLI
mgnify:CR=1 FL=1